MRRASIDTSQDPTHGLVHALRLAARLLEAEQACSSLTRSPLSPVCVVVLLFLPLGTLECWAWGGRQCRRFNDDYSPPGSFGARGSVEDRAEATVIGSSRWEKGRGDGRSARGS